MCEFYRITYMMWNVLMICLPLSSGRLFLMLQRFPVESKGRRKKLQEVITYQFFPFILLPVPFFFLIQRFTYSMLILILFCFDLNRLAMWQPYAFHVSLSDASWWVFLTIKSGTHILLHKELDVLLNYWWLFDGFVLKSKLLFGWWWF